MKHGKHLDGRQITDEEMRDYAIELSNHNNWYDRKLEDLYTILDMVQRLGIEKTREIYTSATEESRSLMAPNKPGYYRANND